MDSTNPTIAEPFAVNKVFPSVRFRAEIPRSGSRTPRRIVFASGWGIGPSGNREGPSSLQKLLKVRPVHSRTLLYPYWVSAMDRDAARRGGTDWGGTVVGLLLGVPLRCSLDHLYCRNRGIYVRRFKGLQIFPRIPGHRTRAPPWSQEFAPSLSKWHHTYDERGLICRFWAVRKEGGTCTSASFTTSRTPNVSRRQRKEL